MQERVRRLREGPGPFGPDGLFDTGSVQGGSVTVMSGPYAEQLPAGGMTVAEVRGRYQDRFDIDPGSLAILDGTVVGDDTVIRTGQLLRFSRRSGEKGSGRNGKARADDSIEIVGDWVHVTSPEGESRFLDLEEVLRRLAPPSMDTAGVVPPDGFKGAASRGPVTIWIHQTAPAVHNLKWIAKDSPQPFGPRARYREVRIALPYVLVFAVFVKDPMGALQLSHANECFFRNDPLRSLEDEVSYPALLNCSRFPDPAGKPLSWICTQHMDMPRLARIDDQNERMRAGFRELGHCLFDTGFNYSSEHHEGASWFSECRDLDPRVATIEAWEDATTEDPWFATRVEWRPVGLSVMGVCERIFGNHGLGATRRRAAGDVARAVLNHGQPRDAKARQKEVAT